MLFLIAAAALLSAPEFSEFDAPGFSQPAAGVWYEAGTASSNLPLGTLGSGFVELSSSGAFGNSSAENNWLAPQPTGASSGFDLSVGGKTLQLRRGMQAPSGMRFWGHFPAADIDFGDTFPGAQVRLRAFSPLIPHDYELSSLPAILFKFSVTNTGAKPLATAASLQWQAPAADFRNASGNVAGALGWRRDSLGPGEKWTVSPVISFAKSTEKLLKPLLRRNAKARAHKILRSEAPEGNAYAFGDVEEFFLDGFAGFNWEQHRRESALISGMRNIGQLTWQLAYGERRCGRNLKGPYGFSGERLPAETEDHALRVSFTPQHPDGNMIALTFCIENTSREALTDLEFGIGVNFDLGGPKHSSAQTAQWDDTARAIVFSDENVPLAAALAENPFPPAETRVSTEHLYKVSIWPQAHQDVEGRRLLSVGASKTSAIRRGAGAFQLSLPAGSYAVDVRGPAGWDASNEAPAEGQIRAGAQGEIPPGETREVLLALAWHFPTWISSDGEQLRHRYAALWKDAEEVLGAALERADEIERKIVAFQSAVYSADVSPALKDALVNSLYILARNSWWMDDGRFFQSESFTGCPITETFVCRFNGSLPLALLFPECERATMRSVAQAQGESGEIPFGFGSPLGSRSPMFHVQHPIVSSEFALLTWRNYALWRDDAYLAETYPALVRALCFAMTLDKDGDGLINEDPGKENGWPANQYYDIWPWFGTSAYTGSIWLAALRAGHACAEKQGDDAFAAELESWFKRGAAAFDEKLWTGQYYRLYNDPANQRRSDTSLANALCGQWFAYTCGLGEMFPREKIASVIDTVFRLNVAATPYGAVNGVAPDGAPDKTFPDHSAVLTIGEVWNFCAMAAFAGRVPEATKLFDTSYENIALRQKTPWNITWSIDPQTGALKWGWNYYSNTCLWSLLQALSPDVFHTLAASSR